MVCAVCRARVRGWDAGIVPDEAFESRRRVPGGRHLPWNSRGPLRKRLWNAGRRRGSRPHSLRHAQGHGHSHRERPGDERAHQHASFRASSPFGDAYERAAAPPRRRRRRRAGRRSALAAHHDRHARRHPCDGPLHHRLRGVRLLRNRSSLLRHRLGGPRRAGADHCWPQRSAAQDREPSSRPVFARPGECVPHPRGSRRRASRTKPALGVLHASVDRR